MADEKDSGTRQEPQAGKGGETKGPSYVAYHVREVGEDKAYYNRVGAAFAHKDGEGHSIQLDALPVDGKIVLRTPKERLGELKEGKDAQSRDEQGQER